MLTQEVSRVRNPSERILANSEETFPLSQKRRIGTNKSYWTLRDYCRIGALIGERRIILEHVRAGTRFETSREAYKRFIAACTIGDYDDA